MISKELRTTPKTYPIFINKKEKKIVIPNFNIIFDYKSKEDVDIYNECKNEIIQKIFSLNEEKEIKKKQLSRNLLSFSFVR